MEIKTKINKWELLDLKSFAQQGNNKQKEKTPQTGSKYLEIMWLIRD